MPISAESVWFADDSLWLRLTDGRTLGVPLTWFPRLLHATPDQRAAWSTSEGGTGLHWDDLDEDISVPALLAGHGDQTIPHRTAAE